ncbi:MAG: tetratricopeptide repeat protein [Balneolales bacterium]
MPRNNKLFSFPSLRLGVALVIFLSFCIVYSCSQTDEDDRERADPGRHSMPKDHAFVGGETCQSCHSEEWEALKGSHHDYAIAEADSESVRGDFDDVEFREEDDVYRFYREGERYMVDISGREGQVEEHEILYTFGWEPLQQYLIDIGKGKWQSLHISWDTEKEQWFSLQPDEQPDPDDWMHWSGGAMNWNTMCADCHSTNLQKNYIAEADSFHTTWSVTDVSCESCHGPGGEHVEFMNSAGSDSATDGRIRRDLNLARNSSQMDEINTCAPCHSLRQELTDDYVHGDNYLDHFDPLLPHPGNYFADGQIRGEVYVYGSFLQSKMYAHDVQCSDCHDPHSLELKANIQDNSLCMQCHEPNYNTPEHHFHEVNTKASQCVNCHMTGRNYMEVDYRRDHSFRIPRPDQSEKFGTPNACNNCHSDQSAAWASRAVDDWHGEERSPHFSETLLKADAEGQGAYADLRKLISDPSQPEIIRATAVWYVGQFADRQHVDILEEAIQSSSPMVRSSAAKALENLPSEMSKPLLTKALNDSVRAVRVSAAQGLTEFADHDFEPVERDHFKNALQEYKTYLDVNEYFPQGLMNRGQFYENQGNIAEAMDAYRRALERDPYFNPARINLAYLHNGQGENDQAEQLLETVTEQEPEYGQAYYSLGLLQAEQNQLQEAIPYFKEASRLMPEQSRVFYNLAIALQTLGQPEEAETAYLQTIELEPENGDYRYGIVTLYLQQEQYEMAQEHAEVLDRLHPNNPNVQQILGIINQR